MKHSYWKHQLCVLVMGLFWLISLPVCAAAEELPSGMVIGDDQGISVRKNGEYLLEVNDVMPGKSWNSTISIINMEKDMSYHLSMLISPPTVTGSLDLSKAIQMTLRYEKTIVYQGPVSGISSDMNLQNKALDLGTFKAGDSRALEVELSLSGEYTKKDFVQKNIMENIWIFHAVKPTSIPQEEQKIYPGTTTPVSDSGFLKPFGKLPSTGEEWRQALLYTSLGLFLSLLILLLWKSKKNGLKKQ